MAVSRNLRSFSSPVSPYLLYLSLLPDLRLALLMVIKDTDSLPPPHAHSGHVSAITVSPSHRRLGLASMMMDLLESVSDREKGWL